MLKEHGSGVEGLGPSLTSATYCATSDKGSTLQVRIIFTSKSYLDNCIQ